MNKKHIIIVTCIILLMIQGCNNKVVEPNQKVQTKDNVQTYDNVENKEEYNLEVVNNTPLLMKSVVVKVSDREEMKTDNKEIEALMDSYVKTGESGRFNILERGEYNLKITLNPKDNYSVSEEFIEDFGNKSVIKYEVDIKENEVKIHKVDNKE